MKWRIFIFLIFSFSTCSNTRALPGAATARVNFHRACYATLSTNADDAAHVPLPCAYQSHHTSPLYSPSIASSCQSWNAQDFAHEIERSLHYCLSCGYSRQQAEQCILDQHALYAFPDFISNIQKFSGYRSYIKELHQTLLQNQGNFYRLRKAIGCINSGYLQLREIIEQLHNDILLKEQQEASQQKTPQYDPHIDRWQVEQEHQNARDTFDAQYDVLSQESIEWHELLEMYREEQLGDATRIERRIQALQEMRNRHIVYTQEVYTLSPSALELLRTVGSDVALYTAHYGNQLQQIIHRECIDGIEHLAAMDTSNTIYPYQDAIAECFDAARQYNQAGLTHKATTITDFCWTLLDYGQAIAEGVVEGVIGAINDIIEHPVQAGICAVAGEYVLAYQLSKVLYNVADIGITALVDADQAQQKWGDYIAPVTGIIDAIKNKQITVRDALKGVTQCAVAWKAQDKLLKGLSSLCTTAKTKAIEFAQNNPLVTPHEYMATPEGKLFKLPTQLHQEGFSKSKTISQFSSANKLKTGLPIKITGKQALEVAQQLGFKKTNFYSHGQPIFQKGNKFITIDADSHNGGFWKMANSIENLSSKKTRLGTYDKNLNRIGD